ncbi:hypothetical protein MLD38_024360 [Melastoma candidum]|uniref:Uncharacterized protein n=1 Tax=Melastoma candidum TaxID=119954 RepID=A0ACB9NSE7_9MYRT|nr:hypothetical protein MLD38_024360 [Melastoma candidum]
MLQSGCPSQLPGVASDVLRTGNDPLLPMLSGPMAATTNILSGVLSSMASPDPAAATHFFTGILSSSGFPRSKSARRRPHDPSPPDPTTTRFGGSEPQRISRSQSPKRQLLAFNDQLSSDWTTATFCSSNGLQVQRRRRPLPPQLRQRATRRRSSPLPISPISSTSVISNPRPKQLQTSTRELDLSEHALQ